MNISDLLDPEKMANLDKQYPTTIKSDKKEVTNWENLHKGFCPKCAWMLTEKESGFECKKCKFFVSKKKHQELINNLKQDND